MVGIEVDGLIELQRALRQVEASLPRELRSANKAAAEIVAEEARRLVPVRTGRLRDSIKARADQRSASVKAGTAARVPYANAVHWGYRNRPQGGSNWPARPFIYDALYARREDVAAAYQESVKKLMRQNL